MVAVSDMGVSIYLGATGRGRGDGMANSLEFRSRLADGDSRAVLIAATT